MTSGGSISLCHRLILPPMLQLCTCGCRVLRSLAATLHHATAIQHNTTITRCGSHKGEGLGTVYVASYAGLGAAAPAWLHTLTMCSAVMQNRTIVTNVVRTQAVFSLTKTQSAHSALTVFAVNSTTCLH